MHDCGETANWGMKTNFILHPVCDWLQAGVGILHN